MLQKNHTDDLLNVCAIYEAQNADNARTLGNGLMTNYMKFFLCNK